LEARLPRREWISLLRRGATPDAPANPVLPGTGLRTEADQTHSGAERLRQSRGLGIASEGFAEEPDQDPETDRDHRQNDRALERNKENEKPGIICGLRPGTAGQARAVFDQ